MVDQYLYNPAIQRLLIRFALMTPPQWQCWIWERGGVYTPDEKQAMKMYAQHHMKGGLRHELMGQNVK